MATTEAARLMRPSLPSRVNQRIWQTSGAVGASRAPNAGQPTLCRSRDRSNRSARAAPAGLEPATRCLEGSRSVQLSYGALGRSLGRGRAPPVEFAGPPDALRPALAGLLQQAGGERVAAEIGGVDRLAAQRLVEPLGLAARGRLGAPRAGPPRDTRPRVQ